MRIRFAYALVMALMLLAARYAGAAAERFDLQERISVDVLSKDAAGIWHAHKALVHKFSDARFVACLETVISVVADCVVIDDEGLVAMVPVRLIEEKI